MRNKPEIITMSIDMYVSNLSSRKMRNQLKRHLNHKISHVSVLDWVRRYTLKVHKCQEPPVTDWWHERIKKTHLTFSVSQNNISVF